MIQTYYDVKQALKSGMSEFTIVAMALVPSEAEIYIPIAKKELLIEQTELGKLLYG